TVMGMVDNDGNVVLGTPAWAGAHAADKIEDPDGDGYAEQLIEFTPTDPNYQKGSSYTYKVKVKIEYLTISFVITGVVNKTITHNLEYNQNYTYVNVADMFDDACVAESVTIPDGYLPSFNVNGTEYAIDKYRKLKNPDNSLTAYKTVTSNQSLAVKFVEGTFIITYDPNLDGDDDVTTGTGVSQKTGIYYGQRPERIADPINGSKTFFGWYHDVIDETTGNPKSVLWDWDHDVVTEDVTLTAKWLEPTDLISITVKPKTGATFTALDTLSLSQIVVEAVFECDVPGEGIKTLDPTVVPLNDLNTVLGYPTADKKLHVNKNGDGTTTVTVSYTADTTNGKKTKSADLILTVDPVLLPTTDWIFNDKTFTHDGTAKSISGSGTYDSTKIKGITYTYYDDMGDPIDKADVIDIGTYTVIASFTTTEDYKVNDRTATLTIVAEQIEVTIDWDPASLSFVYNGKQQYPKPIFKVDGDEVELNYTVSGVDNAIVAGSYTVTVTLTTGGYTIKSGDESARFTITKAVLPVPTLNGTDIIYNGSNINLVDFLDGYNPDIMEIVSGGVELNAGPYSAVVKFKSDAAANCSWQGSSGSTVNVKWEIKKATAIADWGNNYKFVWDGSNHYPELVGIIDVCSNDQSQVDLTKLIYEGDINVSEMGSYTVSVRVPSSEDWFKNYTLENTSYDFVIVPSENVELVSIVWDNLVLTYNGDIQHPTYTVVDMDGKEVPADVLAQINFELPDSKWAGDYTAKANVKAGAEYFIRSGGTCAYKITVNAAGEGKDPTANNSGNEGDGTSFIDKLLASHFPLWQVAVMAVSAILAIIFIAKAAQYG
ncbi:MAG: hypothetical protein K2N18_03045, partial [Clostridia bacterium]|nr:hypothetical protein [Clostridia bacterium]